MQENKYFLLKNNILLLIQHTDERSKITIPYKFYDYLNKWYPSAKISICTTGPQKYKDLGGGGINFYKLIRKDRSTYDDAECSGYDELKLTKKVKFDIMIVIPIIYYQFNI